MTHARIAPGCRRLSPEHVQVQAIAERFEGLPEGVSKGQALAALKQAARPLGISPRLRDAIDVLFAFSAPQDWQPGARPIVWPSNRKLEITLGLARRQVQNVLNALIHANLITPVDSPTGRRWGHRDAKTGKIIEAYRLRPLADCPPPCGFRRYRRARRRRGARTGGLATAAHDRSQGHPADRRDRHRAWARRPRLALLARRSARPGADDSRSGRGDSPVSTAGSGCCERSGETGSVTPKLVLSVSPELKTYI